VCVCARARARISILYKEEKKCAHAKQKHACENPKP